MRLPKRFTISLAALLLAQSLWAADRRTDQSVLVVMTFNAEFLWDGVAPEEGNPQVTFPWKGAPDEAEEHMQRVAEVIIRANPDVIDLVEVENLQALTFQLIDEDSPVWAPDGAIYYRSDGGGGPPDIFTN
jgi:hypothetical protein